MGEELPLPQQLLITWKDNPRWAYILVILATFVWATNAVLGRVLRNDIGPFTLTAARFTVAAVIFTVLAQRLPPAERTPGRHWPLLLIMGLTGVFGFGALYYTGLRFTTATNASLINGAGPLVIGLLGALLLGERFGRRAIVGAVISLTGVAMIAGSGSPQALLGQWFNVGDLLVVVAVVVWGFYSVATRQITRTCSTLSATWLSTLCGLLLLYPAAWWEWRVHPPSVSAPLALAVVYIGVFPSVVGYLAWNEGVRRAGPARAAAFYNMLPLFGALLGVVWLGEAFGLPQLVGGGLIIGGSLLAVWGDSQ